MNFDFTDIFTGIIIAILGWIVSIIKPFFEKVMNSNQYSKEATLIDFLSDKKIDFSKVTVYIKNKKDGEGRVFISDFDLLPDDKNLPYVKFSQDTDGIMMYITSIDYKNIIFSDNDEKKFVSTYIPHSEIETIDYTINKK